ncbi:acyl-CoA dehydrogenase family protein [Aliikangiella maris]|uniref:Acyl-CoA dehydrogenase family protein n=2 Tax=Aliikangiella maris TaxID=3162458 RepID=A0ABV2BU88_9GAMM
MAELHPLVEKATEFSNEVLRPNATTYDQQGAVPREIIDQMSTLGFTGAILPKEFGGSGIDALSYGLITQEISKGCNSTRALLTVHSSLVGETLVKFANQAQKEKYLPDLASGKRIACFSLSEPNIGTDANSLETTYQEFDDHFILNGHKKWITYGGIADIFLVFANGENGITAFIMERGMEGLSTEAMTGLMANRGAYMAEIKFENVIVPKTQLLGRMGLGFNFVASTALFYGRYSIAWAGVGIILAALEEMVTYARKRHQFGQKIAQHQLIQGLIAEAATAYYMARSQCEKIGYLRNDNNEEAVMETNIAKYFTATSAMQVTQNAIQVLGGNGLHSKYPTERLFREAKVLEIIEGTNQIQQTLIANHALRKHFRKASVVSS